MEPWSLPTCTRTQNATTQTGTFEVFLNTGTKTAPAFPATPTDIATNDLPQTAQLADFNCDGLVDIAASTDGCDNSGDDDHACSAWSALLRRDGNVGGRGNGWL